MSIHLSISYQPGGRDQLRRDLLDSLHRGFTKTSACRSAHRRGYSHGFIEEVWSELRWEGLVSQPDYGKPWSLTDEGRAVVEAMGTEAHG